MKNILVTGAARGIGKCTVELLHSEGYKVYGIYNGSSQEADNLQKKLENSVFLQADLSKEENVAKLIEQLKGTKFHSVVNVAGIATGDTAENFSKDDWNRTFQINLVSPLQLTLGLKENIEEGGSVVNVSSDYGFLWGMDMSISYSASKAALSNITKSLAIQLKSRKIRVNAVAPSIVDTDMSAQDPQEVLNEVSRRTPVGRIAQPEEIANVVCFLISEKASYVNAQTLIVDGGYSAWDGLY